MNYRLATILAREAHSADVTKVIDLKLADPVSQFHIVYETVNVTDANPNGHPALCISKIELVDGSDVLFSLSGKECQAADFYHRGKVPGNIILALDGMNAESIFNINFGRYLYDPMFAFDPKKFTNPQLKITIDINGGGIASVSGYLTVYAHIFDSKVVAPTGFLMHKEIKDYVPGASAHEYTDLPTDYPYRKLFIGAQQYGTGPEYLIDTIKLSEDNDRKIPLFLTGFEFLRAITALGPAYREVIVSSGGASGKIWYCTPCYWPRVTISPWEQSARSYVSCAWQGDGGRGYTYLEGIGGNYMIAIEGWAPHGVLELPFGLQDDPTDWYDVSKLGSLRLDILAKSGFTTGDSCKIFMQQLRKYGA
jgi:hypothetical protein